MKEDSISAVERCSSGAEANRDPQIVMQSVVQLREAERTCESARERRRVTYFAIVELTCRGGEGKLPARDLSLDKSVWTLQDDLTPTAQYTTNEADVEEAGTL